MRWEEHLDCPPMVQLSGSPSQPVYLLAWIRSDADPTWRAVVTYIQQHDDQPPERVVVDVAGDRLSTLMPPAAYANVPRLHLNASGAVQPWQRPPVSDS
ncbi:hypothetical protein [Actinomadura rudentiformis]|uniref:Uncharacterized protein n=1 Tax=Actinomadura rudentiformis TaxID=359158 RepID=A0A6H9YWE5_9ACTN|nr:hypothetical protein [Actinomadura rudentiformis]KAB2350307.1 hypothetical protein F8566_11055 [Actinomadura rudentiformis]